MGQGTRRGQAGRPLVGVDGLLGLAQRLQRIAAGEHGPGKILAQNERLVEQGEGPVRLPLLEGDQTPGVDGERITGSPPDRFVEGPASLVELAVGRQSET